LIEMKMEMKKIVVEHEVSPDKIKCSYGEELCKYHTHRDRHHGKKAPIEWNVPKCKLFDCWLSEAYIKCDACIKACSEAKNLVERECATERK